MKKQFIIILLFLFCNCSTVSDIPLNLLLDKIDAELMDKNNIELSLTPQLTETICKNVQNKFTSEEKGILLNHIITKNISHKNLDYIYENCSFLKIKKQFIFKENAYLQNIDLAGLDAPQSIFKKNNLRNANLKYANLSGSNFIDADLSFANLAETNLKNSTNFRKTKLEKTNLKGAYLERLIVTKNWFEDLKKWEVIGYEDIIDQYEIIEEKGTYPYLRKKSDK